MAAFGHLLGGYDAAYVPTGASDPNVVFASAAVADAVMAHVNGSGLAVGRCLIAIIENYQTSEGKIEIPKCLSKYLLGAKFLNQKGHLE
mgnify:CR=1 FL=1